MTKPTTFERIQSPAAPDAPEPHTPGPFIRHGVMVRDTVETTGGMFCIRQVQTVINRAGNAVPVMGEILAYAYSRADADLMAAAPAMLETLRIAESAITGTLAARGYRDGDDLDTWAHVVRAEVAALATIRTAIAAAEGRSHG